MNTSDGWRIGALAARTGLSVRTLHHYDHLGLLRASYRTPSGHRLYTATDIHRLQQIMALRHLGLSLAGIGQVLGREGVDLEAVLERQVEALGRRIAQDQAVRRRVQGALILVRGGRDIPVEHVLTMIEEMNTMQQDLQNLFDKHGLTEWMKQRAEVLGTEAWHQLKVEKQSLRGELQRHLENGTDPHSAEVASLVDRWQTLQHTFTDGNPDIKTALTRVQEESEAAGHPMVDPAVRRYIMAALALPVGGKK